VTATTRRIELGELGLDRGAHVLVKHALVPVEPGSVFEVVGTDPHLAVHLGAWCREQGHSFEPEDGRLLVRRGERAHGRWRGAEVTGRSDPAAEGAVLEAPPSRWGLAARGASVEIGTPEFDFDIRDKDTVWSDDLARIYAKAVAAQWDPATAIEWDAPFELPEEVESAVVQVMTYLIENEMAALVVPARFLGRIHPHFREVLQLLAVQTADEARHIEVFTRRATLRRPDLGLSTAGGQASLKTLLDEADFAMAAFLLSVLGEGSFLSLLWFLELNAPDPVTRQICKLAAQDEARHVAFGLAHLKRHASLDPQLLGRLAAAIEHRHDQLQHTAGLNEEVFDALVVLAAGQWSHEAIGRGFDQVVGLKGDMDRGRQQRLRKLGFSELEAERLSSLHTRNFM
jgi:hypothetical protein